LKAFEVKALDYLLKPVEPNRLDETIQKLAINDDEFQSNAQAPKIDRSSRPLSLTDKIFIKDGEKCFFVALENIRMFESDGNYVKVYFDKSRPLILRSLNSLEERLDPEHFFRANRKYIINLNCITFVENWFNGGLQVELTNGEKIEISRRQAIKFKEQFTL
jgi:two-component system LytT family response regulator